MLPLSFATVEITVLRPGVVNDHGKLVPDYTNLTSHSEPGCIVQPGGSGEDIAEDLTTADRIIYAPPGADVRRLDLVELPSQSGRWRVRSEPAPWRPPLGYLDHLALVAVRHTEGAL